MLINVTAVMNSQRIHSTLCELNNKPLCDFIEDCSQPTFYKLCNKLEKKTRLIKNCLLTLTTTFLNP